MQTFIQWASALGMSEHFVGQGANHHIDSQSIDMFNELRDKFNDHMSAYGLSYGTSEEYEYRFSLFMKKEKAMKEIMSEQNDNGENYTFTLDHNQFSTFTDDEIKKYLGLLPE